MLPCQQLFLNLPKILPSPSNHSHTCPSSCWYMLARYSNSLGVYATCLQRRNYPLGLCCDFSLVIIGWKKEKMEPDLERDKHHFVKYLPQLGSFGSFQLNGSSIHSKGEGAHRTGRIKSYQGSASLGHAPRYPRLKPLILTFIVSGIWPSYEICFGCCWIFFELR